MNALGFMAMKLLMYDYFGERYLNMKGGSFSFLITFCTSQMTVGISFQEAIFSVFTLCSKIANGITGSNTTRGLNAQSILTIQKCVLSFSFL